MNLLRVDPFVTTNNWEEAFDCLQAVERRAVLLTLHERPSRPFLVAGGSEEPNGAGDVSETELSLNDVDVELDPVRMHHVHLPKLEAAGYVEYSEDGERVSPGDSFADIQPLLDAIAENEKSLPGITG